MQQLIILIVALVNAVLQMFGYNTLPIADANVSEIVSTIFLIGATLYNTWKNRNISSASQTGQKVVDAIKSGELLADDWRKFVSSQKGMVLMNGCNQTNYGN